MKWSQGVLLAAAACLAGGCIQGERAIHVKADGSGRIVDKVKLVGPFAEMLKGFAEMDKGSPEEEQAKKQAKVQAAAEKMGPGVSVVSYQADEDGTENMVFAFTDISKIAVEGVPTPMIGDESEEEGGGPSGAGPYTFRLEKDGKRTRLVIVNPMGGEQEAEQPEDDGAADDADDDDGAGELAEGMEQAVEQSADEMLKMMKPMLGGARLKTTLSVEGSKVESDSPLLAGSTLTLMEIDFDTLMKSPEGLALLSQMESKPDPAMLQGVEGLKTPTQPEVVISFEGK